MTADAARPAEALRVLAADEDRAALEATSAVLRALGHEVVAYAVGAAEAADKVAADDPDVSVVVLHDDDQHALELIEELREYASGPVIALLEGEDAGFVTAAAQRGIDAYARPVTPDTVQGAIEVAMRRHAERRALTDEVAQLQGALERRALIERAKGVLMERHGVGDREAFEMLRARARSTNASVLGLARSVLEGHALLPKAP
jgi:AmiR/NasT family two-component response regulator